MCLGLGLGLGLSVGIGRVGFVFAIRSSSRRRIDVE